MDLFSNEKENHCDIPQCASAQKPSTLILTLYSPQGALMLLPINWRYVTLLTRNKSSSLSQHLNGRFLAL